MAIDFRPFGTAGRHRRSGLRADSKLRRARITAALVATVTLAPCVLAATGAPVRVTTIEGDVIAGVSADGAEAGRVAVETPAGRREIRIDGIALIELHGDTGTDSSPGREHDGDPTRRPAGAVQGVELFLRGGGHIAGTIVDSTENGIIAETPLDPRTEIGFRELSAMRFHDAAPDARSETLLADTLADRKPGVDVLITRGERDATMLRGSVQRIGPDGGTFVFNGRERSFGFDKVHAIVFATPPGEHAPASAVAELRDGSVLPGTLLAMDADSIRFDGAIGGERTWPIDQVARVVIHSDRVAHVSDLKPVRTDFEGMLHRDWPIGVDETVSGGPLMLGGKRFERGLGVHSKTTLVYQIDAAFERLVATVGIDDAYRPRGSVVFRIIGDGRTLLDTGTITGADEPRTINVDVTGTGELSLVVDFGPDLDLADHAIWASARLIKPPAAGATP